MKLLLLLLCTAALPGRAEDDPLARESMRLALEHSLLGFDHARLTVSLFLQRGPRDPGEERRVVVRTGRRGAALDRALCFLSPADLRNTAFLSVAGEGGGQYLWLPELGRLRQVSRTSATEPFLGTTFSFRDVEGRRLSDATYRRLPDEAVGDQACEVIEAQLNPGADEEYSRIVTFVRKTDHLPLRLRFFDRQGKPRKTLYTRKIGKGPGGVSYAQAVRMEDHLSGASTVLEILHADFDDHAAPASFTPEQLRRGVDCAP